MGLATSRLRLVDAESIVGNVKGGCSWERRDVGRQETLHGACCVGHHAAKRWQSFFGIFSPSPAFRLISYLCAISAAHSPPYVPYFGFSNADPDTYRYRTWTDVEMRELHHNSPPALVTFVLHPPPGSQ